MNDAQAKTFVESVLSGHTPNELQFVRVITRFETFYASGWKDNGDRYGDPRGSNNWGAVKYFGEGPNWFTYTDETEHERFRSYASLDAGLRDAASIILKPNVKAAVNKGDGLAAVAAMKANRYFTADLPKYQGAVSKQYSDMVSNTGEKPLLSFKGSSGKGLLAWLGIGITAVGVGVALSDKYQRGRNWFE
jgi:hypothetical protein